jgi:hypothetical protein
VPAKIHPTALQVFARQAKHLAVLLGGHDQANGSGWYRCRCPVHRGDAPDTLALKPTPYGVLAKCFKGCTAAELKKALQAVAKGKPLPPVDTAAPVRISSVELMKIAAGIWHQSVPIGGTLAETYLRRRGITLELPATLRCHPALFHTRSKLHAPALVAVVQSVGGEMLAIHRTWLAVDGSAKAGLDPVRMALGSVKGHAVRLGEAVSQVIVGEGIETVLSAMQLYGLPGWSALSTSGLLALQLPQHLTNITIAADNDVPGIRAAQQLRDRLKLQGRAVYLVTPDQAAADFNDVLCRQSLHNVVDRL